MNEIKKFFSDAGARRFIRIVLVLLGALLIFEFGVIAGSRHFRHAPLGGGLPPMGMYNGMPHLYMVDGHGDVGTVSAIALPAITITERDGEVNQIVVASTTQIREIENRGAGPETEAAVPAENIHTGDFIVAIGEPDQNGTLTAALIRIMPFSTSTGAQ